MTMRIGPKALRTREVLEREEMQLQICVGRVYARLRTLREYNAPEVIRVHDARILERYMHRLQRIKKQLDVYVDAEIDVWFEKYLAGEAD